MARAIGANAIMAAVFEEVYGTPPAPGAYFKLPFVSTQLGEEQGLLASDLLGYGREPLPPSLDVANNEGDVVVPVDARNFGYWLKLMMGDPVTVGAVAASGSYLFSAQPGAGSTITVNGQMITFVAADPAANQVLIGANVNATVVALAAALNASAVPGVAEATYVAAAASLNITVDALGIGGNAFTIAAGGPSNATPSGATLTGGLNSHTFVSGAAALPSLAAEIGLPDVPSYGMNFGIRGNTMKVALQRSGLLNATIGLIAQGETIAGAAVTGDPGDLSALPVERFSQFQGSVSRAGTPLAHVVSADFTFSNNLDKVEVIRPDGRIEDADPGIVAMTGQIVTRFADTVLLDQAVSEAPCVIAFGWTLPDGSALSVTNHAVYLPKPKRPVTGPKGIMATFAFQSSQDVSGHTTTIVLTNDVAGY